MASTTPMSPFANRPLAIKEIVSEAEGFKWDPDIPMKFWLRTANMLFLEGRSYLSDGNFAQAYLIYMRYLDLVTNRLPKHPDAKNPEERRALHKLYKSLGDVMSNLEKIKPIIEDNYNGWLAHSKKQGRQKQEANRPQPHSPLAYEERASRDPALSSTHRLLDAGNNRDLAVELAEREFRRRDTDRGASRNIGISHEDKQSKRDMSFWNNWTNELADRQAEDEEIFRKKMESTRRALDGDESDYANDIPRTDSRPLAATSPLTNYRYPSIAQSQPIRYEPDHVHARKPSAPQPPRPPKEDILRRHEISPSRTPVPELPAKVQISPERTLLTPETPQELPTPPPKIREPSPVPQGQQRLTFKPAAYLESGEPLRSVFLPSQLRHKFLSIAAEKTRRGLEMCGILCGAAVKNALFVRCLLIPEQTSTPDTCETENENTMLEYCMNNDLIILGWIHTHPTQTCFMSSRDLHTQSGYQIMLPESIAIVCAPSFEPSYGIFRLTKPPGLDYILGCTQSSTFHPHAMDNLYTKAQSPPGHVYETDKLEFDVHDLRPGARNSTVHHKSF
ncbi:uncharacterized protein F4812DRAFT_357209 [Daldinia caldariorum]|uniref:uncharacterized protein n=1 Tax=Daldinia caldariorum TaxID=326644 RepID=UPI0020080620|nr:uncharacterized protein F4812DRAFT_357209 [Daldinia caldariorum]KAI1468163.1 hypothetical protein F4812DRAFT_357209 [Daldinia caldariorum]